MTRKALSAVAMGLALFSALAVEAQTIPQTFTFTARVSNADGPLTGTHQIILRMYDAGTAGTKLWEESHIDVPVNNGLLTLAMGSETNITNADLTDAGVWVEVVVDGSTLAPRIQLRAVPYARRSQDTVRLGGNLPNFYSPATHNHDAAYINASGDTMSGALGVDTGGIRTMSTVGWDSWFPYWPNGWNYLSGNGTIFRHPSYGESAAIAADGIARFAQIRMNDDWGYDCPVNWFCNGNFWDISLLSVYYNGLVQRSDRRLKKDIHSIETGLDRILKLRPVTYRWKNPKQTGVHYGFIAQDVEAVIPDLVTENNKGYKALDTQGILPVTVKAVQELKAENDKLRADVDQLRDEIEAIKAGKPLPAKTGKTASRWVIPVGLGSGIALVFAFGALAAVRIRRKGPPA